MGMIFTDNFYLLKYRHFVDILQNTYHLVKYLQKMRV